MERIGLVGINWKREGAQAISEYSQRLDDDPSTLQHIANQLGVLELVCLKTCNRVELAFVVERPEDLPLVRRRAFSVLRGRDSEGGEAETALRLWGGEGAVEHVFLVAAGLESARLGEREIVGQVRLAAERARAAGTLGQRLSLVYAEALKVAKRVHGETEVGHGRASLAEIGLERVQRHLTEHPGLVAVVGAGRMSRRSGEELREAGFSVLMVNRSVEKAKEIAESIDAQWSSLEQFLSGPPPISALITSTAASEPIFNVGELERLCQGQALVIVDLAVPPDVVLEDARGLNIEVLDMDQILALSRQTHERRLAEIGEARVLVDEAVIRVRRFSMERTLAPILAAMQARYRETLAEGLKQLEGVRLGDNGVENWTERMVHRLAHIPSSALRGIAREGGEDAIRSFFDGADPRLEAVVDRTLAHPDRIESRPHREEGR